MDNMSTKNTSDNELLWTNGDFATEVPPQNENAVITIVVIAVAVVLTIALLFGMAVFIDCRHQKLNENGKREPRKLFSFAVPNFLKFRRFSNEEDSFADKMYADGNVIA